MKRLVLILSLLTCTVADANTATRGDLESLRRRIGELEQSIGADLEARDAEQAALRDIEQRIGRLSNEARKLHRQQAQAADRLASLRSQQLRMADDRARQLNWLARTARASYMSGRQETLKLLLNQEQPDRLARLLRYQEYFQSARVDRIEILNRELKELLAMAAKVEQAAAELRQRQQAVNEQQEKLNAARKQRADALAAVQKRLGSQQQRLTSLRADEKRLEGLLRDMRQTLDDIPARPSGEPFGQLANKLPWPVPRQLAARFGSTREGPVRWNGVLLDVAAGTPVRAIHPGRVVYADWLRGYGLLTILDHGGGYLTLYGHNQSLARDVGEWVSTGDVLALAGDSGGRDRAGLYFEIRRNGEPVNPDRWCNSRVTLPPVAFK